MCGETSLMDDDESTKSPEKGGGFCLKYMLSNLNCYDYDFEIFIDIMIFMIYKPKRDTVLTNLERAFVVVF